MINCLSQVAHQMRKGSSGSKKQQNLLAESKPKVQAEDSLEAPLKQARHLSFRHVLHHALPKVLGQHRPQTVELKALVDQINSPTWTFSDGERIYKALTHLIAAEPTNTAGILWRGILARIMGYDARSDLEFILAKDPSNRLARLNLAILPVTCLEVRMEDRSLERYLNIIDSFLKQNPQDYYGQLVKVALNYQETPRTEKTIDALESLYLRYPGRASTTALMAAVFQQGSHPHAASDFARETLLFEPLHPLAHNIILRNSAFEESTSMEKHYVKPPNGAGVDSVDFVFMAPHIQQDPDNFLSTPACSY